MQTKIWLVNKDNINKEIIKEAAKIIKEDGLVAFPTETVYGLGANGLSEEASAKIYKAKGRPSDNPLILHIADKKEINNLVTEVPPNAKLLMDKFWPGPLTIIFKRKNHIPNIITGGLDTVAIRMPSSTIALELIKAANVPIAGPSANTSGRPSPTTAEAVSYDLAGKIDAIIDGGACQIGVESTVIDCTTPIPTLLRPGGITLEMLEETLGIVDIDKALVEKSVIPRSPGMKYTHYAPIAPMYLVKGEARGKLLSYKIKEALAEGKKVGAIVSDETAKILPKEAVTIIYGHQGQYNLIAANLYSSLRYFDQKEVDIIFAEAVEENGLGLAVMNRLLKASGYRIIDC